MQIFEANACVEKEMTIIISYEHDNGVDGIIINESQQDVKYVKGKEGILVSQHHSNMEMIFLTTTRKENEARRIEESSIKRVHI